jgi:hypothetical protein
MGNKYDDLKTKSEKNEAFIKAHERMKKDGVSFFEAVMMESTDEDSVLTSKSIGQSIKNIEKTEKLSKKDGKALVKQLIDDSNLTDEEAWEQLDSFLNFGKLK